MPPYDSEYYRERALTELDLAKSAERQNVAEIHEELAKQYLALAEHPELTRPSPFNWPGGQTGSDVSGSIKEGLVVFR